MDNYRRRCGNLLFSREIGGQPGNSLCANRGFPKAMLNSQSVGRKQLRLPYYQKDVNGHFGCVNAIEFSKNEEFLASGGDDKRVLIWKTSELFTMTTKPKAEMMKGKHESNIFCLTFTSDAGQLISSGNDHTVLIHNLLTGDPMDVYILEEAVYSISVHPDTDRIFVTACEDGRVQLWDQRLPSTADAVIIASHHAAFQSASFNPAEGRLIATANSRDGVQLWDVRRPKWCVMRYNVERASCMCVRWDSRGERLLALRRRMMPVLFHVGNSSPIAYFDHPGYYNSCTMKSCSFAGLDDECAVSGSDNFNIYMWPVPVVDAGSFNGTNKEMKPIQMKGCALELKGHRSIVNQVRYSKNHQMLVSSGVEKVVKLWSPWPMPGGRGCGQPRPLYTHQEYLNMVIRDGGLPASQDDQESRGAMDEDPKMLAFFDSLVLREIENSSSGDDSSDESIAGQTIRVLLEADDASVNSGEMRRRRSGHARDDAIEQYNNEIVESESSSNSSASSSSTVSIIDRLAGFGDSGSQSDDSLLSDTDDRPASDPEYDRRRRSLGSLFNDSSSGNQHGNFESGELDSLGSGLVDLDPALG